MVEARLRRQFLARRSPEEGESERAESVDGPGV